MSTTRRRGNSEGSNPVQRADGRWQVHVRHANEDGVSRRHMAYGSTPKEARDKATEVRKRIRAQPTVEELPFLVLAEQRWNVAEACRLLKRRASDPVDDPRSSVQAQRAELGDAVVLKYLGTRSSTRCE